MRSLPLFLKRYFWDVDFSKLDKKAYATFIIERILEEGDGKAVNWMKKNFALALLRKTLARSRRISPRSANFWQLIFNMKRDKILCLNKSFQKKPEPIWKY